MRTVLITGAAGLIGSETARHFAAKGYHVVGIDNDMRSHFFGAEASTSWNRSMLQAELPDYEHHSVDIRDSEAVDRIFAEHAGAIDAVIHTAAQPSHDWASTEPLTDFSVNALATALLLDTVRRRAGDAVFIFTSTNKVYGDLPNSLPLVELEDRWEVASDHAYYVNGIDESMSIDQSKHSLFGASKVAADVLTQEYGRYFGLKTAVFRGGCLTGPSHSGAKLHGFLAYLMRCALTGEPYTVIGYKGKQVRDNIHSSDLVNAFWEVCRAPRAGQVYNMGGGRHSCCSVREAIALCEDLTGNILRCTYEDTPRSGDHTWWISDVGKFKRHYPQWDYRYTLRETLVEMRDAMDARYTLKGVDR